MKVRKYISKKMVYRLFLFLAVVLSAILFDAFHEGSDHLASETHHRTDAQDLRMGHMYFYNPVSNFKVRTGVDKLFSGYIFSGSQNDFLTKYHNYRTFHLLKAESPNERIPFLLMAHFMKFNFCHHSSPDDYPSVA